MTTLAAIGSLYREISRPSIELVVVIIMTYYFPFGQDPISESLKPTARYIRNKTGAQYF